MPNYVKNIVEIRGEKSEIKKVFDLFRKDGKVDFNKVVPMPKEISTEDLVYGQKPKNSKELIEKYGADNWFDWNLQNWGTKWSAFTLADHEKMLDETNSKLEFYTAWEMPHEFYLKLSKLFPQCEFFVEYADECIGSGCGHSVYADGEVVCHEAIRSEEADRFACKVWGYNYDGWKKEIEEEFKRNGRL